MSQITANGKPVVVASPCTLEKSLVAQNLLPQGVEAALAAGEATA